MKNRIIFFIIILLPIAVFYHLGLLELRLEEPRRALVALEMMFRKSYIVPEIHGELYYTKPPLFNWMIALSFWISGNYSEWAARLPGILSYFLTGWLIYWFAKKYFPKDTAILAAFFFLTASDLMIFGTIISAEIDLFFTLLIALQQLSLYYFFSKKQWFSMFAVSYLFTALALLTKGLPAILFQGISVITICLVNKKYRLLFSWQHIIGIFCFAVIAGCYFYLYQEATGEVYAYLAKLYSDAADKSVLQNSLLNSFLNFLASPLYMLRFFSPWIIYLLFLFGKRRGSEGANYWKNDCIRFLTWAVCLNIFPMLFTVKTSANYIYPLFPLIAVLLAYIYTEYVAIRPRLNKVLNIVFTGIMVLALLGIIAAPFIGLVRQHIHNLGVKTIMLVLIISAILYFFLKKPSLSIYLLIAFIATLRLAESIYYLPIYKNTTTQLQYKPFIKEMMEQTAGAPVYLSGEPDVYQAHLSAGPFSLDTLTLSTPPFVQFNAPFYYSAFTGKAMEYKKEMSSGNYYLLFSDEKPDSSKLKLVYSARPSPRRPDFFYLVTPR